MPPPTHANALEISPSEYITLFSASGNNTVVHAQSEVTYLKGAKDYTEIVLRTGSRHLVAGSLEKWSRRLGEYGFLRVHKSYCVNLAMVRSWAECNRHLVVTVEGKGEIIVAANYKREFLRYVK